MRSLDIAHLIIGMGDAAADSELGRLQSTKVDYPDSRYLAFGSSDTTVLIWDLRTASGRR